MILTCPECGTKYVVKDGAIPPQGRQVRCASCKHSWHQEPEEAAAPAPAPLAETPPPAASFDPEVESMGGPPVADHADPAPGEAPDDVRAHAYVSDLPEPPVETAEEPRDSADGDADVRTALESGGEMADPVVAEHEAYDADPAYHGEPMASLAFDDGAADAPGGRWKWLLGALVVAALAVAAFLVLAPDALKAKVGLAAPGPSPLQVVLDTRGRQQLASGNEMLTLSGRIINPTDETMAVPPLTAELRERQSNRVVYRYTFNAGAKSLGPKETTSFNHAEVDVPTGGDDISLTLGA